MALFTAVQHLCSFNIVAPIIYHLLPNVWKASYTISASIFVDVPYRPVYCTDKFISCVVPGPSQWSFHCGESRPQWSNGHHTRLWIRRSRVRSRRGSMDFFQSVKILSMTSFGREVKPWVPCRRFKGT